MEEEFKDEAMTETIQPSVWAPDSRTLIAIAERVAVVETQQRANKEDMNVVRSSLHLINNEMQKFVAAEQQCASYLRQIAESTKDIPALATASSAFMEMRPELRALLSERDQRTGREEFGNRFSKIVAAAAALVLVIGGIVGGAIWLAQHLKMP